MPAHDEVPSLELLVHRIRDVLDRQGCSFEVIVVDDGSRDGTPSLLRRLNEEDPRFRARILRFRQGKSAALGTGFSAARGRVVVTMDADLQDLPEEIPGLVAALDEQDLDVAQGWRELREDTGFKVFASRVFNGLCSAFSGLKLRDVNCGFKAIRREVLPELRLGDDMHRFIPVLCHRRGFRVGEVPVRHARRAFGRSKYGPLRYLRGFSDLIGVVLLPRLLHAISPWLGPAGVLSMLAGLICLGLLTGSVATGRLGQLWELGLSTGGFWAVGVLCFALSYLDRMSFTTDQAHHAPHPEVAETIG